MVFNSLISNTDDHLRDHGFVLTEKGWRLSRAFDSNPSTDKDGLALNIDMDSNALDLGFVKSAGVYFRLSEKEMKVIIDEATSSVASWQQWAKEIGSFRKEQALMRGFQNIIYYLVK